MWRAAQPAKHFPRLREIGNFLEYEVRRGCLTLQLAPPFSGRPEGGLERNLNHIKTTTLEGNIMKKSILILACAAIAPFAFAQTSTTTTERTTTAPATTTETTTYSSGTVTTYEPGKTIVVKGPEGPIDFVFGTTARILDGAGRIVTAPLRAGQKVRVYYTPTGERKVVERVV